MTSFVKRREYAQEKDGSEGCRPSSSWPSFLMLFSPFMAALITLVAQSSTQGCSFPMEVGEKSARNVNSDLIDPVANTISLRSPLHCRQNTLSHVHFSDLVSVYQEYWELPNLLSHQTPQFPFHIAYEPFSQAITFNNGLLSYWLSRSSCPFGLYSTASNISNIHHALSGDPRPHRSE
ncbi:hypothetical protein L218DRAFT_527287 [Marasmius fiardii PR-910]|nr:hypothetical protein L218DRAFT_527287 [Marasmius fiardii PR-910]